MYLDSLNENKTATFVDDIKEELTRRAGETIQNEDFKKAALDGQLSEEVITESEDLSEEVKNTILESLGESDEVKSVFREAALDEDGDLEIELEEDSSIVISSALARELYEEASEDVLEEGRSKYLSKKNIKAGMVVVDKMKYKSLKSRADGEELNVPDSYKMYVDKENGEYILREYESGGRMRKLKKYFVGAKKFPREWIILHGETVGNVNEAKNEKYNKVFRAIAKHCKLDPEKVDEADEKKKEKFYGLLEKCWDEDKDEVPDSCPVDMGMGE